MYYKEQVTFVIQETQAALTILDVYLPTIDGFEINSEIQKLSSVSYISAISQLDCMSYLSANKAYSKDNLESIMQAVKVYFNK